MSSLVFLIVGVMSTMIALIVVSMVVIIQLSYREINKDCEERFLRHLELRDIEAECLENYNNNSNSKQKDEIKTVMEGYHMPIMEDFTKREFNADTDTIAKITIQVFNRHPTSEELINLLPKNVLECNIRRLNMCADKVEATYFSWIPDEKWENSVKESENKNHNLNELQKQLQDLNDLIETIEFKLEGRQSYLKFTMDKIFDPKAVIDKNRKYNYINSNSIENNSEIAFENQQPKREEFIEAGYELDKTSKELKSLNIKRDEIKYRIKKLINLDY